ncbi:MAG TPA: gluconate 2-dehydrogenase subunit 3 family protein [Bryobacteraceae bacterium]|nr:gluconate 2-dehydrogenase subunit 3 family protein [Bryobacteraceae bacterium]
MKRREFLTIPAAALGGTLLYTLAGEPFRLQAQDGNVKVPLRFFSAAEARVIGAACERIFPSDSTGPGAKEAGVVIYIDRQLAGPYGADKYRYTKGPWVESVPEHGYQAKADPRETYRDGIAKLGANFPELPVEAQIQKLQSMEKTHFFQLLRAHTIEGMFSDPMHGGNKDLIGWQLIGYPGPRMSNKQDVDQHFNTEFRPKPQGLEQIMHRKGNPWEDEKV